MPKSTAKKNSAPENKDVPVDENKIKEELDKMNYPSEEDIMNPVSGAEKVPHNVSNRENPGDTLDVPGSEEDDYMEDIGEEDEENNYYSLGGDNND